MTDLPPSQRLAVVLSHPTQYYSPWFRWIAEHTSVRVRVFYLWKFGVSEEHDPQFGTALKWDVDLLSGYESEFVPNVSRSPGAESFWGFNNPDLGARLSAWRPDALLLFGYKWASHLRAIAWAALHRVPVIFRGDSHFLGRPLPAPHRLLPLRLLFGRFSAVTYVGSANRAYFERLGVPASKLFLAPHAVNGEWFDHADADAAAGAAALRSRLGFAPRTRVVLFAGKLMPSKQPIELLRAFIALSPPGAALVFVGEGGEREALQELARDARPGSVHFLPFANQSEMPARYLLADIFALPSRGYYETWGLAVDEAMRMGVPCLVSDRVGCQRDLVIPGETGWVFRAEEPGALQAALSGALAAVAGDAGRERFRRAVIAKIGTHTYAESTAGLLAAMESVRR